MNKPPVKKQLNKSIKMILWVLIAYFFILGMMYTFQRNLLFHPGGENPFIRSHEPLKPFVYKTPLGMNLRGLWAAPQPGMPTIIYFQGNGGSLTSRLFKAKVFIKHGYGVAMVGYRGYNGNPGYPSETNLYDDARSAINSIEKRGVAEKDMVLYGESLGTGVAVQIAAEMPDIKALVLEAPYTSIPDVAASHYWFFPVHRLIKDRFESAKKIGILEMPILVIHGTNDTVVPYKFGKKLFGLILSDKKQFLSIKGATHTNLYDYGAGEGTHDFLQKLR